MARVLSFHALIRSPATAGSRLLLHPSLPASRLLSLRRRSGRPGRVHLVEIVLDAEGSGSGTGSGTGSGSGSAELDALRKRRVDDAIHGMVARQYAPDWLPFVPGASYWAPAQKRPYHFLELFTQLADARLADPKSSNSLSSEEKMSFTTERGWPSSAFFLEGLSPREVKIPHKAAKAQSDDEDS